MTATPRKRDIAVLSGALLIFTIGLLWFTTTLITNIGYLKTHQLIPGLVSAYQYHLSLESKQGNPLECNGDCVAAYQSMKKHYDSDALKAAYHDYPHHTSTLGYLFTPAPDNVELLKKAARLAYHLQFTEKTAQEAKAVAGNPAAKSSPAEIDSAEVLTEAEYIDGLMHLYKQYDTVPMATIMLHLLILTLYLIGSRSWAADNTMSRRVKLYNSLSRSFFVVLACSALSLGMVFCAAM